MTDTYQPSPIKTNSKARMLLLVFVPLVLAVIAIITVFILNQRKSVAPLKSKAATTTTITDNFDGSSIDTGKWSITDDPGGDVVQTGGIVTITRPLTNGVQNSKSLTTVQSITGDFSTEVTMLNYNIGSGGSSDSYLMMGSAQGFLGVGWSKDASGSNVVYLANANPTYQRLREKTLPAGINSIKVKLLRIGVIVQGFVDSGSGFELIGTLNTNVFIGNGAIYLRVYNNGNNNHSNSDVSLSYDNFSAQVNLLGVPSPTTGTPDACSVGFTVLALGTPGPSPTALPSATPRATPNATPPTNCIEVAKDVTALPNCQEAEVKLRIKGICTLNQQQRAPLDVMLVFDRSGSMQGDKITAAKSAVNSLISQLDPSLDRVGLASYANTATLNQGLTNNFATVQTKVNSLTADGGTNIGDGVFVGQAEMQAHKRSQAIPIMIVLTDGIANHRHIGASCATYPSTPNACTDDAINQAVVAKQAGTTVFTIGLGLHTVTTDSTQAVLDLALSVLKTMASSLDKFYDSPTSGELAGILNAIVNIIKTLITLDTAITDTLPDGVSYILDSGNPPPTTINGQTLVWDIGTISTNQEAIVTFKVKFNSTAANQLVDVYPTSGVDYTDTFGQVFTVPFPETRFSPLCASPSPTPGIGGPVCGNTCTLNSQCPTSLICYITAGNTSGVCRNPSCQTDSDCSCDTTQPATSPTPVASVIPDVPRAGTLWPTLLIVAVGLVLLTIGLAI